MGVCQSKTAVKSAPNAVPKEEAPSSDPEKKALTSIHGKAPPKPMSFAIYRQAHESIRGTFKELSAALANEDLDTFTEEWKAFVKAAAVHQTMEDDGIFPLLDKFDDAVTKGKLPEEHDSVAKLEKPVIAAVDAKDVAALNLCFGVYTAAYEAHLKKEEDIMMKLTRKTAETPAARALVVHELLKTVHEIPEEFKFFCTWNMQKLEKHKPLFAARVFVWGLQYCSTPGQWATFLPAIKAGLTPEAYEVMVREFQIDQPGKIDAKASTYIDESPLVASSLVRDVWADDFKAETPLEVTYGDIKLAAGNELTPKQMENAPTVSWEASDKDLYTLILTDPDAPSRETPLFREFIHWVVTDIPGSDVSKGTEVAAYVGAAPPANSGMHRYAFFVFKQKSQGQVNAEECTKYCEGRGGKKMAEIASKYDLGTPVAYDFCEAQWGIECDAYHVALGFVPPPQYQSEAQKKANSAEETK